MEVYKSLSEVKGMKVCKKCGRWFEDKSDKRKLLYCSACRKQKNEVDRIEEEREIGRKQSRREQALESEIKLFKCIDCGEIFGKNKNNGVTKRCKKCQEQFEYKQQHSSLVERVCLKCNNVFEISSKSRRTICDKCYKEQIKAKDRERKRKQK